MGLGLDHGDQQMWDALMGRRLTDVSIPTCWREAFFIAPQRDPAKPNEGATGVIIFRSDRDLTSASADQRALRLVYDRLCHHYRLTRDELHLHLTTYDDVLLIAETEARDTGRGRAG